MEVWKAESNATMQSAAALGCVVVGLVLAAGFRDAGFQGAWTSNAMAGFLLGLLLLLIGIAGFVVSGRQTIVVDPSRRLITIEDSTRLGTKKRLIRFGDITHVGIGFVGGKSGHVMIYYLALTLSGGKTYALFGPGRFYPGSSDRTVVEGWRRRLEGYLGLPG